MAVILETEINPLVVLKDRNFLVQYTKQKNAGAMTRYHYNLSHYEIVFFVEGIMRCCIGSEAFILNADRDMAFLAIMDKGVSHHHSYNATLPHGMYHIFINDAYLDHFAELAGCRLFEILKPAEVRRLHGDDREQLLSSLKAIVNDPPDAWTEAMQTSLIDTFFVRLLRSRYETQPAETSASTSRDILRIIRYIDENYAQELSLSAIADRFAFSKSYFCRLFHAETGLTFTEYVNQIRVKQAVRLLKASPLSIQIIAQQTGFQTPAYFNRVFKKQMAQTPREYRQLG